MSKAISYSMFFLSFIPLWITVIFIDGKSLIEGCENKYTEKISIILILLNVFICLIVLLVKINKKEHTYLYIIEKTTEKKMITAEYLLSYILPLFAFDFTKWDEVVKFLIFFLTFSYLCIRHNSFSVNIVLELLRYKMYDCNLINGDGKSVERNVISRKNPLVCKGEEVRIVPLNNEFWLDK